MRVNENCCVVTSIQVTLTLMMWPWPCPGLGYMLNACGLSLGLGLVLCGLVKIHAMHFICLAGPQRNENLYHYRH